MDKHFFPTIVHDFKSSSQYFCPSVVRFCAESHELHSSQGAKRSSAIIMPRVALIQISQKDRVERVKTTEMVRH